MTQLLDTINLALEEIEEQLLAEFTRVRNTISEHRFEKIDTGIKVALESVVDELKVDLEGTGDRVDLQLQTEHHENLFVRMIVLKHLLQTNVPTAYLQEAHDDIADSRRKLEGRVLANRTTDTDQTEEESENTGFFGSIRGLFNREPNQQAEHRNRISITAREADEAQETKETEDIEVYQDNGIYSASRELAMLANLINTGSTRPSASLSGKANFDSRELSDTNTKSGQKLAQTPEEIRQKLAGSSPQEGMASNFGAQVKSRNVSASRRYTESEPEHDQEPNQAQRTTEAKASSADEIRQKLANRGADTNTENRGASVFQSRELSNPAPKVRQKLGAPSIPIPKPQPKQKPKKLTEKVDKSNLAQSPEAIRAKLEARTPDPTASGKASFQSKDVDHLQPQEYISRKVEKPDPAALKETEKPSGKAIFEVKELSNPPRRN